MKVLNPLSIYSFLLEEENLNYNFENIFKEAKELVSSQNEKLSPEEFKKWKDDNPETMWRARVWALYQQDKTDIPLASWIDNNPKYKDNIYLKSAVASSKPKKSKYLDLPEPEPKQPSQDTTPVKSLTRPSLEDEYKKAYSRYNYLIYIKKEFSREEFAEKYPEEFKKARAWASYTVNFKKQYPSKPFEDFLKNYLIKKTNRSVKSPLEQEYKKAFNNYVYSIQKAELSRDGFIEKYPEEYKKYLIWKSYLNKRAKDPSISFEDALKAHQIKSTLPSLEQEYKKAFNYYNNLVRIKKELSREEFAEKYPEEFKKARVWSNYKAYRAASGLKPFEDFLKDYQARQVEKSVKSPLEQEYRKAHSRYAYLVNAKKELSRDEFTEKYPEELEKARAYGYYIRKKDKNPSISFEDALKDYQAKQPSLSPLAQEYRKAYSHYDNLVKYKKELSKEEFAEKYPEEFKKFRAWNSYKVNFQKQYPSKSFEDFLKDYQARQVKQSSLSPLAQEHKKAFNLYAYSVNIKKELSKEEFIEKYPEEFKKYLVWNSYRNKKSNFKSFEEFFKKYKSLNELNYLLYEYIKNISLNIL